MTTRLDLMKHLNLVPFNNGPALPQEMWNLIYKFLKQIEDYENMLSDCELYHLRIQQGWVIRTLPISTQNNRIDRTWNSATFMERIKWYLGLIDKDSLKFWSPAMLQASIK